MNKFHQVVLSTVTGLLVLGLCTSGCEDEVRVGEIKPIIQLTQDWDGDGSFEPLPAASSGDADYLVDFGQVVVRQRATRYVSISNDSNARLALNLDPPDLGVFLGPDTSPDGPFFVDQPTRTVLEPGESTTFAVHYIPETDGEDAGSILIKSNDTEHKEIVVALAGQGVSPDIEVCLIDEDGAETCNQRMTDAGPVDVPLALDFGMLDLGESSSHRFLVRSIGEFPLTVAAGGGRAGVDFGTETSNEYTLQPEPYTGTLASGDERTFTVMYTPFDGGADEGRVEISSDDPDEPLVVIQILGNGLAPKICPQPPFLVDFGSIQINSTSEKTYTFTSCGNQVLTITELSIDSGAHGFFSFAADVTTPFDLSPGEAFDVELQYAPTAEGAHAGELLIRSNDPNAGEGTIDLVGKATPIPTCDVYVWPDAVDFGQVSTSGFSNQVVTISNTGDADCNIVGIEPPAGSPEFSLPTVPVLPAVIQPGSAKQFTIQYRPVDEGVDQDVVTVLCENDPDEEETEVEVRGEGVQPPPCDFQADPALLNFGTVPMGESRTLTTRVWNFGSEECTLWDWGLTPASDLSFQPAAPPFPRPEVLPGEYKEIEVTVVPQSSGLITGELEIKGGENPLMTDKLYVSLTAGGEASRMCLNPSTLDFGPVNVGDMRDMAFTVSSCGAGTLRVRQVTFDGANADFSFVMPPGAPFSLRAGETKDILVRYSPSDPGADFGRVLVSGNDDNTPTGVVELVGNYDGSCPSVLDCQPDHLVFPATEIGVGFGSDQSFTCTNHGTEPLTVVDVSRGAGTSPEFRVSAPGIPLMLTPGGELHVEVGYIPTDVGVDTGSVVVQSEFTAEGCDNFTLITVPIEAEGIEADLPECIEPRTFEPVLEFAWPNGNITEPTFKHVFMTPIVVNLTDDNADGYINEEDVPDIVFNAFEGATSSVSEPAMLRAISGDDGHEVWTVADPRFRTNFETQLAAGDIDGDNLPEVVASKLVVTDSGDIEGKFVTGNILCLEHDGTFKWESEPWTGAEDDIEDGSALGIADLDHDGHPEIFRGSSVFDHNGRLLWEGEAGRGSLGPKGHGCFSTAADLDGQGGMELIAGNTAYHADGTVMWTADKPDGLVGIADFNQDGNPEVFLFSSGFGGGTLILDGLTGTVLSQLDSSYGVNAILAPVIADIDGSGGPEVGVVGTCSVDTGGGEQEDTECFWGIDVNEANFSMTLLWEEVLNDQTLGGGNTAFDFEGDGPFEVLQNDETYVNIYAGLAHNLIYQAERWSVTGWELPIVVDVDNDDHAEIIVIQNGLGMDKGILVYGNIDNDWVATRRIWNQFDFHITNVRENGTIPRFEVPNWSLYNNYLANEPFCE